MPRTLVIGSKDCMKICKNIVVVVVWLVDFCLKIKSIFNFEAIIFVQKLFLSFFLLLLLFFVCVWVGVGVGVWVFFHKIQAQTP